jgi:tetratricopeptide (TPR) repeat protein
LAALGRFDEAAGQYQTALRLKPDYPEASNNLGLALVALGRGREAVAYYQDALRMKPTYVAAWTNLARLLTHDPDQGGNPQRAVAVAQQSCDLTRHQDPACLGTLAMTYAAAGRFPEAVAAAEQARQLAAAAGQAELVKTLEAQLDLYRAGKPYREPQPQGR